MTACEVRDLKPGCAGASWDYLGGWQVSAFFTALLLSSLMAAAGNAAIIGNDVIERPSNDGFANFTLALNSDTFLFDGVLTEWDVWAGNDGELGLLVLEDLGSGSYAVKASQGETVTAGLNSFAFTPDSGTSAVSAGWLLGLWIGSADVDYTNGVGSGVDYGANGAQAVLPTSGSTLSLVDANLSRTYSVQATYIPAPATVALLGFGLLLLGRRVR